MPQSTSMRCDAVTLMGKTFKPSIILSWSMHTLSSQKVGCLRQKKGGRHIATFEATLDASPPAPPPPPGGAKFARQSQTHPTSFAL